jgi:uncharacterized protein involved in exopolysaccharide biosynthesis
MTKAMKTKSASSTMLATAREDLKAARAVVAELKAKVASIRDEAKRVRESAKASKAAARAQKREAAIAKAKARLERLMNPVGSKAKKVAKRPGPTIVTKFDKSGKAVAKTVNGKAVAV